MERKTSILADCLKRSFSWSVYARFSGHEHSVNLVSHANRSTKDATSSTTGEDAPDQSNVNELVGMALKRSGSKYELDMRGLLSPTNEPHSTHERVDSSMNITILQEAVKELKWLTRLDISGNGLAELPESLGDLVKLRSLVVSENELVALPQSISKLKELATLSMEKNKIEELPWGIAQCKALMQLNGDFNNLKSLPDAVGRLSKLKILSVHFNCLKSLPKSMSSMVSLVELDVRFNRLEDIPENLCLATSLVRLNLASNFSNLKHLPESIGRLQKLRELDVSFNGLTYLPDSIAILTNLQTLNLEGNPFLLPPLQIAEQGKEVVLGFMIQYVEKEKKMMKMRKKSSLAKLVYKLSRILKRRNRRVNGDLQLLA